MDVGMYFEQNYNELLNIAKTLNTRYYSDLLHDTYIQVELNKHNIRDIDNLKSYITTVMRRQVTGYYETSNKEQASEHIDINETYDDVTDLEVEDLIKHFDDETKTIIKYLMNGCSQKDIADMMGLNYNTVRSKILRLRKNIKKQI